MEIRRVDVYDDVRFSETVRLQHGGFLVDGVAYEVEIISQGEAIVRGPDAGVFLPVIEEFRFYTPHITKFYEENRTLLKEFPAVTLLELPMERIQPSQFYVDMDKIAAIRSFIHRPEDIVIPVLLHGERYIALDGHTRLYYGVMHGWNSVRAVIDTSDEWVFRFVDEARKRNIFQPKDMVPVSHEEYEEQWNRFCDRMFAGEG